METPEEFVCRIRDRYEDSFTMDWEDAEKEVVARDAAIRKECAEKLHEVMLQKLHINFPTRMLGATAQYYHDEFEKQFQVYRAAIMGEQ